MPSRGALEDAPANYCCRAQTKLDEMAGKKKTCTNCEERVLVGSGSDPLASQNRIMNRKKRVILIPPVVYITCLLYYIVCKIL